MTAYIFTLLICIHADLPVSGLTSDLTNCQAECGIVKDAGRQQEVSQQNDTASDVIDIDTNMDDHVRIVNGYRPESNRPWMALIVLNDKAGSGGQMSSMCGGALVNTRFILTAAHCVCLEYPCVRRTPGQKGMKPSGDDYKRRFTVYLGLNHRKLKDRDRDASLRHKVQAIRLHEKWHLGETFPNDLAVIELAKKVVFSDEVRPLCVSNDPGFDVVPKNARQPDVTAYIAGWGVLWDRCANDNHGPSKNAYCHFPFMYKGKQYNECARIENPSAHNVLCEKFRAWQKLNRMRPLHKNETARLFYGRNNSQSIVCYSTEVGQYGWCATCDKAATRPGQPGFCQNEEVSLNLREGHSEKEQALWGWCRKWCQQKDVSIAEALMETELNILTDDQCERMTQSRSEGDFGMDFDKQVELCVGKKHKKSKAKAYRANLNEEHETGGPGQRAGGKGLSHFHAGSGNSKGRSKEFKLNFVDITGDGEKSGEDFYIGGSDSCTGDSGGPLWIWRNIDGQKRAFAVGVVSRGDGCAKVNSPGVYARISRNLDWIHKHVKKGNCD